MRVHPCPRNHPQEISAAVGFTLCVLCIKQVENNLRIIPALHQESLHHVSPAPRRTNPTKVSGSRKRDHLDIAVLDVRHNILVILESWSGIVVEKLGRIAPHRSVPQLARFLTANLEWITAQPPAGDFADEIETIATELRHTIDPDPDGLNRLTRQCVVDGCAGTITAAPHKAENTGRSNIRCSSGHAWELREWLTLRHLIERQRKSVGA
ncbi:hypothetical protein ACWD3I_39570 [Streptomyces sp. NPDC002817]|uniref:hypothetical protein n=1 Tax=Streptomyces sp. NPDC088357 TaxID=3154655 RepID=UPI003442FEC0